MAATDLQAEMWLAARGAFSREHIEVADLAGAEAMAITLLDAFRTRNAGEGDRA